MNTPYPNYHKIKKFNGFSYFVSINENLHKEYFAPFSNEKKADEYFFRQLELKHGLKQSQIVEYTERTKISCKIN